jgi:Matrixin
MRTRTSTLVAISLLASACGGGGGATAPGPVPTAAAAAPAAVAPEVRDGGTGASVAGALTTPPQVIPGAPLAVSAAGYLRRQQFLVGGQAVFLWPQSEDYVRSIVYAGGDYGLIRWDHGFRVKAWPGTEDKMAVVVAEASRVSGLPITLTDGTAEVEIVLDPSDPALADLNALAVTYRTYSGLTITGARIVFRSVGEFLGNTRQHGGRTNTSLHEIGHVLGLDHSIDRHDVMSEDDERNPTLTYGPDEELALRMMYGHRAAGNAAPDRAPGVPTATSVRAPRAVIVD